MSTETTKTTQPGPKPNTDVGFEFTSYLKITDPATKQVILSTKGD